MEVSKQMLHENSPLDSESDPATAGAAKPAASIGFVVVVGVGVSVAVSDSVGVVLGGAVIDVVVAVIDVVVAVIVLTVFVGLTDSSGTDSSCLWSGIVAAAPMISDSDSVVAASPCRVAHPCEREEGLSL